MRLTATKLTMSNNTMRALSLGNSSLKLPNLTSIDAAMVGCYSRLPCKDLKCPMRPDASIHHILERYFRNFLLRRASLILIKNKKAFSSSTHSFKICRSILIEKSRWMSRKFGEMILYASSQEHQKLVPETGIKIVSQ